MILKYEYVVEDTVEKNKWNIHIESGCRLCSLEPVCKRGPTWPEPTKNYYNPRVMGFLQKGNFVFRILYLWRHDMSRCLLDGFWVPNIIIITLLLFFDSWIYIYIYSTFQNGTCSFILANIWFDFSIENDGVKATPEYNSHSGIF